MTLLASLQDYKNYNKITSPNNDVQIAMLLDSSSTYIKNYCGRAFIDYFNTNKIEYGNASNKVVFVAELPIISVVSVKTSVDGGVTQTTLVENTDYFVDIERAAIISAYNCFVVSPHEFKSLEIEYTGGFNTTPEDILTATIELTKYYIDEMFTPSKALQSASIENFTSSSIKIPNHITSILNSYRLI